MADEEYRRNLAEIQNSKKQNHGLDQNSKKKILRGQDSELPEAPSGTQSKESLRGLKGSRQWKIQFPKKIKKSCLGERVR